MAVGGVCQGVGMNNFHTITESENGSLFKVTFADGTSANYRGSLYLHPSGALHMKAEGKTFYFAPGGWKWVEMDDSEVQHLPPQIF